MMEVFVENFWLRRRKERQTKHYLNKAISDMVKKAFVQNMKKQQRKIWTP